MLVLLERQTVQRKQKLWDARKAVSPLKFMLLITDALGNPLDFILTGGQTSDIGQAENLLALTVEGVVTLVADKSYDSDAFIQTLTEKGVEPVIPPRTNRINTRDFDWFVYKERHLIECFFNKIKYYRRISSRYEEMTGNYMGFIRFASALIWLC